MKAAVVYYSMSGNTAYVAEKIAQSLNADLIPLTPAKAYPDSGFKKFFWGGKSALMGEKPALEPYSFSADEYDMIIFGTPVWASNPAPPLRTFLFEQGNTLAGKRFAAYVCCMGGGGEKALQKLITMLPSGKQMATMVLIDPKDASTPEKEATIAAFCEKLL